MESLKISPLSVQPGPGAAMSFVLVFVAGNPDRPLTDADLAQAADAKTVPRWLHIHKAAEIPLTARLDPARLAALRATLARDRIDVFLVPSAGRKKSLLIADMDATIVVGETLDELAACGGMKERIAAITARAMRGELDFIAALSERVGLLKGLPVAALEETLAATRLTPGASRLVGVMRHAGATCVLVSGGFTFFTEAIAHQVGFTSSHGNRLGLDNGVLDGTVLPPVLDKDAKLAFLREYRDRAGLASVDVMALGDGANDLPMLLEAGLGIGVYPKPLVREALDNNIVYSDLTSALYIQGYTQAEIDLALPIQSS